MGSIAMNWASLPIMGLTIALLSGAGAPGIAADLTLYEGQTIVTGERAETRIPALRDCLLQVFVKLSGDISLASEPRAVRLSEQAPSYMVSYRYRDRMEGIPHHDEQGSRDRPYDLTVAFDPVKVDAALASLGSSAWIDRPPLVALITIRTEAGSFFLAADDRHGIDQKDALFAAAAQFGMSLHLPTRTDLTRMKHIAPDGQGAGSDQIAPRSGTGDPENRVAGHRTPAGRYPAAAVLLSGTLDWDAEALGWRAAWHLEAPGVMDSRWAISGVTFDNAFRNAIGGAAARLAKIDRQTPNSLPHH